MLYFNISSTPHNFVTNFYLVVTTSDYLMVKEVKKVGIVGQAGDWSGMDI